MPPRSIHPAFISAATAMAASPSQQVPQTTSRGAPKTRPKRPTRKRIRVSHLTKKYRRNSLDYDEAVLIADQSTTQKKPPANNNSTAMTTATARQSSAATIMASALQAVMHELDLTDVELSKPAPPCLPARTVRYSRFPHDWDDVMSQACTSVSHALAKGFDRLRVDIAGARQMADMPAVVPAAVAYAAILAGVVDRLVGHLQDLINTGCDNFCARGVIILFNCAADAAVARRYLPSAACANVVVAVLGDVHHSTYAGNAIILIAPSNRMGNPAQIELVEHVHYSNFNDRNWVIVVNPDLVALTYFPSLSNEARQPLFLADYLTTYYLDAAAYPSKYAMGAVLRCFPRMWELYLRKVDDDRGFRLVSEGKCRPSPEKIHCEFSWRIEGELDLQ